MLEGGDEIKKDEQPENTKTGPAESIKESIDTINPSKSTKKVKPRCPMPVRKPREPKPEYKRRQINTNGIRLDKLTFGTLRRYQYFFGLDKQKDKPFIDNREQLLEAVEEHFANELKVNPVDIIYRFLSTKKDPDQGLPAGDYFLRGPKTRMARKET